MQLKFLAALSASALVPVLVRHRNSPPKIEYKILENLVEEKNWGEGLEGIKTNFFGKPASTTTIPAQLIKKYWCELIPVYIERYDNLFFKIYISEPVNIDQSKTVEEITIYLNSLLEKMILKNPDQWIWTHNRWKN